MPVNQTEPTTVFFSYSRADKEKALPVIKAIEDAGFKVWWDGMLEVGANFLETTEEALVSAKAVVVLWSSTSVASHWVRDEATSGRERSRLVPLSLDGTIPPLGFRQVQFIDIQQWKGNPEHPAITELVSVLSELHGRPARTPAERAKQARANTTGMSPSRRNILIGGSLAAALALGGGYMSGIFSSQPALSNSLGVLPFSNLSGNDDFNFVSEGLSSEIRNSLSQNQAFIVAARSSSIAATKEALSVKEISRKLNVANIIEGDINVIENVVRVNVAFVEGGTGFVRWTRKFEHVLDEVLKIHDEITKAIHDTFSIKFADGEGKKTGQTSNPAAFNEYLKGENLIRQSLTNESMDQAISHYNSAITLDPSFGAALVSKSQIQFWKGVSSYDLSISQRLRQEAILTARAAISVAPEYSDAHNNLGDLLFNANLDIKGASEAFSQAQLLGDRKSSSLARFARFALMTGKGREAVSVAQMAVDLDPLNLSIKEVLGLAYWASGQLEEALKIFKDIQTSNPERVLVNARIANIQMMNGNIEESLVSCKKETYKLAKQTCEALAHIYGDDRVTSDKILAEIIEEYGDYAAYQIAQIYAAKNDISKGLKWLNTAYDLNDSAMIQFYIDPFLENLRNEPEFIDLLAKVGFDD